MTDTSEKKWYVLRVQSGKEELVKATLEKRLRAADLERYVSRILVPSQAFTEIRGGKRRVVERRTYPGYIMVEMAVNEDTWFLVRETPGISDFLGSASTPVPLGSHEVEKLLGEAEKKEEQPKLKVDFKVGETVKIKEGPFQNFEGTVEELILVKGLVKVTVIIFGRPTQVELEYWQVEPI
jgi:transcriptional antiterminator NusG